MLSKQEQDPDVVTLGRLTKGYIALPKRQGDLNNFKQIPIQFLPTKKYFYQGTFTYLFLNTAE